jgi:proteic killer suppression protein
MIKSFRNKELQKLWEGRRSKIDARFLKRIARRLDALDAASVAEDLNLPEFDFHSLLGFDPKRYSIHVNGPWAITFEFEDGDAYRVDLEQYH